MGRHSLFSLVCFFPYFLWILTLCYRFWHYDKNTQFTYLFYERIRCRSQWSDEHEKRKEEKRKKLEVVETSYFIIMYLTWESMTTIHTGCLKRVTKEFIIYSQNPLFLKTFLLTFLIHPDWAWEITRLWFKPLPISATPRYISKATK